MSSQEKAEEAVINQVKCAFDEMDKDGSGKVNSMELREFCKRIKGFGSVSEALVEIDTSDDGLISFEELRDFILNKVPKNNIKEANLRRLFNEVDTSGDGRIDKGELTALMCQFGYSQEEVDGIMADVGAGDGLISEEEFIEGFKKTC